MIHPDLAVLITTQNHRERVADAERRRLVRTRHPRPRAPRHRPR